MAYHAVELHLLQRLERAHHRYHALVAYVGVQHLVGVVLGFEIAELSLAGYGAGARFEPPAPGREQFRHVDAQPTRKAREPVVGRGHQPAFNLGNGGDRQSAAIRQGLDRQAVRLSSASSASALRARCEFGDMLVPTLQR